MKEFYIRINIVKSVIWELPHTCFKLLNIVRFDKITTAQQGLQHFIGINLLVPGLRAQRIMI